MHSPAGQSCDFSSSVYSLPPKIELSPPQSFSVAAVLEHDSSFHIDLSFHIGSVRDVAVAPLAAFSAVATAHPRGVARGFGDAELEGVSDFSGAYSGYVQETAEIGADANHVAGVDTDAAEELQSGGYAGVGEVVGGLGLAVAGTRIDAFAHYWPKSGPQPLLSLISSFQPAAPLA